MAEADIQFTGGSRAGLTAVEHHSQSRGRNGELSETGLGSEERYSLEGEWRADNRWKIHKLQRIVLSMECNSRTGDYFMCGPDQEVYTWATALLRKAIPASAILHAWIGEPGIKGSVPPSNEFQWFFPRIGSHCFHLWTQPECCPNLK